MVSGLKAEVVEGSRIIDSRVDLLVSFFGADPSKYQPHPSMDEIVLDVKAPKSGFCVTSFDRHGPSYQQRALDAERDYRARGYQVDNVKHDERRGIAGFRFRHELGVTQ